MRAQPDPVRSSPEAALNGFILQPPRQRPEGGTMLIMAVHQVPSLTQERYEEVVRRLTGKARIESAADLPFEGLLVHVAGQGKDGFCIVDVFDSEDAVARFNQAMSSIPREVGIEEPPEFFPAHTFVASPGDA
jgi:hypothetical protein